MYNREQAEINKMYLKRSISFEKFLSTYYGITGLDSKLKEMKLDHETLAGIFGFVKTLNLDEYQFCVEDVLTGEIIPVRDAFGNVEFYPNPRLEFEEEMLEIEEIVITLPSGKSINEKIDRIDDMSLEELCVFRKELEIAKDKKYSKLVRKAIRKQKKEKQKVYKRYKKQKIELSVEGRGIIDD